MSDFAKRLADLSPQKHALLLKLLEQRRGDQHAHQITRQSRDVNRFPLSYGQQRLWLLDQVNPDNAGFVESLPLRLKGEINIRLLHRCFNEIVRRHEALRTTFTDTDGKAAQVVSESLVLPMPIINLAALPEAGRAAKAHSLTVEEGQRPFNLSTGPLIRITLLKLAEREHQLLLTMHHIISDAWSLGVILRELTALYSAFNEGRPASLPELPIQYVDFACWQNELLQGDYFKSQLSYWKQQLAGAPDHLALPTDHPRPPSQTFRGAMLTAELPPQVTGELKALSRIERATLGTTVLCAFLVLLHHLSEQDDLVIGYSVANRPRVEIEDLIGFFVNNLPLRARLTGDPTFRSLLHQVREVSLGAFAHQDIPFQRLVEALRPQRSLSRNPLYQIIFNYQSDEMPAIDLQGISISTPELDNQTAVWDLSLLVSVSAGQHLACALRFSTDLFTHDTIRRMLEQFELILHIAIASPDTPLSYFTCKLIEADKRQQEQQRKERKSLNIGKLGRLPRRVIA